MKKQFFYAFLVLITCFSFLYFENSRHEKTYRVLDINSQNEICIDTNSDSKCSKEEYFKLKHVVFPDEFYKQDFLKLNLYLKNSLLNKDVTFLKHPGVATKYVQIYLNGKDFALELLNKRLVAPYYKDIPPNYAIYDDNLFNKITFPKSKNNVYLEIIESRTPNAQSGAIEAFFINPNKYLKPSFKPRTNAAQAILYNINNAKTSIDVCIYGIEGQNDIINALIKAKNRGVRVRIVVDSNPDGEDAYLDTKVLRREFPTVSDDSMYIMHNKFFVFDSQKVATFTLNLSPSGSGGYDANTGFIINSRVVARVFEDEFEQMYASKFHKNKSKNELVGFNLDDNTNISVYFSPSSDILTPILNEIKNAEKEILVSAFYLTHREIINELVLAQKRGVKVLVLIDALSSYNFKERINILRQNNVKVKVENWGGKNHQKNILVDSRTIITGSANFSKNAVLNNDENVLIIKNHTLSKAYRNYFYNLYNSIDDKYLYRYVRAESFESVNSCFDGIDNNFDGLIDSKDKGCIR